jgi:hypothetical protein
MRSRKEAFEDLARGGGAPTGWNFSRGQRLSANGFSRLPAKLPGCAARASSPPADNAFYAS